MWRIDTDLEPEDLGAPYDRRAAAYDRLVRSRLYNRLLWGTSPREYEAFAAGALAGSEGPLLDAGAGSAAATARLHRTARREVVLVDRSRPMLERAAARIAGDDHALPPHVRLVQADLLSLPFAPRRFTTVLCMGVLHLLEDPTALVGALRSQLAPGGRLHVSSLVDAGRPVGRRYLRALHRAGEVATPRTPAEVAAVLGCDVEVRGSMAYGVLGAAAT